MTEYDIMKSMENTPIKGRYRHYKGGEYEVVGIGTHSESGERLVAYRALYGESLLWFRPLDMFIEDVKYEDKIQPRFALIEKYDDSVT